MLDRRSRQVLNIYSEHIGHQEAEISQLNSILDDYRNKFGILEISDRSEFKKANLEQQLQSIRKENQSLSLQIKTIENEITEQQLNLNQMNEMLQTLTRQPSSEDLTSLQKNVNELEKITQELDKKVRVLQDELEQLMTSKR
ncbi:MAG: hypothetical protein ACXAC7_20870 [Candidatus Hodarchaeales archaeon]|jgi:chromosome segregation ATPase